MTRLRMLRAAVWVCWGVAALAAVVHIVLDVFRLPSPDLVPDIGIGIAVLASLVFGLLARREEELDDYLALRDAETDEEFATVREHLQRRLTRSRTAAKASIVVGILIAAGSIVLSGFHFGPIGLSTFGSALFANGVVALVMLPAARPPEVAPD